MIPSMDPPLCRDTSVPRKALRLITVVVFASLSCFFASLFWGERNILRMSSIGNLQQVRVIQISGNIDTQATQVY